MAFELREVEELAESLGGLNAAKRELTRRGVPIWEGLYNHGAFEAFNKEPNRTNIRARDKKFSTLSETDGVGTLKSIMDSLKLDIVLHQYNGTNWLLLRNENKKRKMVKVYSTQWHSANNRASFLVSGFLGPENPPYFVFVCYANSSAWVLTLEKLVQMHSKVFNRKGIYVQDSIVKPVDTDPEGIKTSYSIPKKYRHVYAKSEENVTTGHLYIHFDPKDDFRLLSASQLGL